MTLRLDRRQRAMLQEMGIALPVLPARQAPPADTGAHGAGAPPATPDDARAGARVGAAAPPEPSMPLESAPGAGLAQAPSAAPAASAPLSASNPLAAPALPAAPAACSAQAVLLAPPVLPYAAAGAEGDAAAGETGWLVLLECAQPDDPMAGDAGRLLDNMLRALGLHRQPATRVAGLMPPGAPGADVAVPLAQALAQSRPRMVLLLGLGAARAVLGDGEPLARLRAGVHQLQDGTPAAVSHDPAYLLRAPQAKAAAWHDLCHALARERAQAR